MFFTHAMMQIQMNDMVTRIVVLLPRTLATRITTSRGCGVVSLPAVEVAVVAAVVIATVDRCVSMIYM